MLKLRPGSSVKVEKNKEIHAEARHTHTDTLVCVCVCVCVQMTYKNKYRWNKKTVVVVLGAFFSPSPATYPLSLFFFSPVVYLFVCFLYFSGSSLASQPQPRAKDHRPPNSPSVNAHRFIYIYTYIHTYIRSEEHTSELQSLV